MTANQIKKAKVDYAIIIVTSISKANPRLGKLCAADIMDIAEAIHKSGVHSEMTSLLCLCDCEATK